MGEVDCLGHLGINIVFDTFPANPKDHHYRKWGAAEAQVYWNAGGRSLILQPDKRFIAGSIIWQFPAPFVCDRAIDLTKTSAAINNAGLGRGNQDQRGCVGRILDQRLWGAGRKSHQNATKNDTEHRAAAGKFFVSWHIRQAIPRYP